MRVIGMASFMNAAGAQAALLRLMDGLRARGHETQAWYFYEEQPIFAGHEGVFSFYQKPRLSALEYATLPALVSAKLAKARPDAVVTFLPLACVVGQSAAALSGVKKRIASQRTPAASHGAPMRIADRLLGAWGLYSHNVCVSRTVEAGFSRYPKAYTKRLHVVENGLQWTGSALTRAAARAKFSLQDGEVAMIATGRMKVQKNYDFMLEVFAPVANASLLIAGDGPGMAALVERAKTLGIADRVRFLGALTPSAVADLLRAGDIFVQTSSFEGLSNSILEAMSEGLAIVASDIPAQRDVLVDANGRACGRLAPLNAKSVWSALLTDLVLDTAARSALGAAARARVGDRFGLARMIDGFEEVLGAD